MKFSVIITFALSLACVTSFSISSSHPAKTGNGGNERPVLYATESSSSSITAEADIDTTTTSSYGTDKARTDLLETAQSLHDEYGCLLIDSSAQDELKQAVEDLEAAAAASSSSSSPPSDPQALVGEWVLLCSTASATLENGPLDTIKGIDTSKLPFFNEGPLKDIRDALNKSLKVEQVIKSGETSDGIDRIDHVLQYQPPDTLAEFLDNVPDAIKSLNINPLQVSQSQVTLIHKAEIESVIPVLKTQLSLSSIVVNVAGKSQILDPNGADVLGINIPFGEFLNAGSFDTTYMDDTLRISRSKVGGIVDQLRVFVRDDSTSSGSSATDTSTITAEDTVENEDDENAPVEGAGSDGSDVGPSDVE